MKTKNNQNPIVKIKKRIYITAAIYGLIASLLILFIIFFCLKTIKKNSEELVAGKSSIAFLENQVSEIEKFKNNYQSYEPNFNKINQLYVDQKNPVDLFKFLEKEASFYKIKSTVILSKNSLSQNSQSINFEISIQGGFLDALNFLEKIETGPYLIKIKNLTIRKATENNIPKKSMSEIIEANFSIEAFIN